MGLFSHGYHSGPMLGPSIILPCIKLCHSWIEVCGSKKKLRRAYKYNSRCTKRPNAVKSGEGDLLFGRYVLPSSPLPHPCIVTSTTSLCIIQVQRFAYCNENLCTLCSKSWYINLEYIPHRIHACILL